MLVIDHPPCGVRRRGCKEAYLLDVEVGNEIVLRAADVIGSRLKSVSRAEGSDDGHNGHTNSTQHHLYRARSVGIGTSG